LPTPLRFVDQDLARAEDLAFLSLRKDHPLGLALGFSDHDSHDTLRGTQTFLQLIPILIGIHLDARNAA